MGQSDFLKNLKNAVENGEFNSDAAKKINEIDKIADKVEKTLKNEGKNLEEVLDEKINKRITDSGFKTVGENEIGEFNDQYENEMNKIKLIDMTSKSLANIIDMDEMITESVKDLLEHIKEVEVLFENKLSGNENELKMFFEQIKQIKEKYTLIIN